MKPVERVARALCKADGTSWETIFYVFHKDLRQEYINRARVAMEEVRKATDRHHVSRLDGPTSRVVFEALSGKTLKETQP